MNRKILALNLALLALLGGSAGFIAGTWLAKVLGHAIFGSTMVVDPVLFPIVLGIAGLVTLLGSAAAIRRAVKYDPVLALRGEG